MINIKDYIVGDEQSGLIRVKITPKAQKNEIFSVLEDNTVKIRIKAVPERGKANKELIKFLSNEIGVDRNNIIIVGGASEQLKLIRIKYN